MGTTAPPPVAAQPARDPAAGPATMRPGARLRAILLGSAGNLVEYYDFYCYAAFSLYFAGEFFPKGDAVSQALSSAGVFAFGFFMRPIGALLFGSIADHVGRRRALMASVLLMCLGSLMIAVLPGYAVLGPAAPALLVLARVIQGLSLGGEYGSSATYLAEMSPPGRRGFWSSFQYVTLIGGQLLALGVLLLLQAVLPGESELRAWGWRLGFGFGAALALVTLWMRRGLPETEAFERQGEGARRSAKLRALLEHPRESLIVVGLTMGGTLAFYVYTIYMQKFLRLSGGLTTPQATAVVAGSLAVALLLQPAYGALSDRIGRRPLLLGFGVLGTLFTAPLLSAIRSAGSPGEAFLWLVLAWLIVSGYTSINAVVKAELFPASVRATGVGVPYAVAVSVFGGSAEYVALWFKDQGHETWFYGYATAVIACSLVVYALLREPLRTSRIEAEAKGGTARP